MITNTHEKEQILCSSDLKENTEDRQVLDEETLDRSSLFHFEEENNIYLMDVIKS